jgi:hypothetical protein
MEKYQEFLIEANKAFNTADHMAYVTYPLVNDIKLLVNIVENLEKAVKAGVNAVLEFDRLYKRISPLPDNFESRFSIFQRSSVPRYGFGGEQISLVIDLHKIMNNHKKSPMEFIRKDKFVICSGNYRMKTLTLLDAKKYITNAKAFILKVNNILRR